MRANPSERGVTLATSLVVLLAMTMLGVSAMRSTVLEERLAGNYRSSAQVFNIAESGLEDAVLLLETSGALDNGFDDELTTNGGVLLDTVAHSEGSYTVTVLDNDDGDGDPAADVDSTVRLSATGMAGSSRRTLELIVQLVPVGGNEKAILTQGDLTISGTATTAGTLPDVHTNGALDISGSLDTPGKATAAGALVNAGGGVIGGGASGGEPAESIPPIDPTAFQGYADFTLAADGKVYDSGGLEVGDGTGGGNWNGWDFSGTNWTLSTNEHVDGFLYVEGNALVSGSPGAGGGLWQITLVAEGSIVISGNPVMENHVDPGDPEAINNLLLVAGGDIDIAGTPTQPFEGIIAAHEQVKILGDPVIDGNIIAEGAADVHAYVPAGGTEIAGTFALTNNGLATPFGFPSIVRTAWKHVMN